MMNPSPNKTIRRRAVHWTLNGIQLLVLTLVIAPGNIRACGINELAELVELAEPVATEPLYAGTAKVDITHPTAKVHDPSYAKALVLKQGKTTVALITVDAVAIGGIGSIRDSFLQSVRDNLAKDPGILAENVIVNASHCHGVVRSDCEADVVELVRRANRNLVKVSAGVGSATENRISENRRVFLKDGSQVDMRRAYAFAWDDQIASIGPIDPQVGLLKLDTVEGKNVAVVYNFACHPIMNPPNKGSSADFPAYASKVIEQAMGDESMAFFVQGCGGDINPVHYKEPTTLPDAEPLGLKLGVRIVESLRNIKMNPEAKLALRSQSVSLPRAADLAERIQRIEHLRTRLVDSLQGTNVNFKSFLPLLIEQRISPEFPSASAQTYINDQLQGQEQLKLSDEEKKLQVETYLANIRKMEEITRLNANLSLLKMHQQKQANVALRTIACEMTAIRVGEFRLLTFPGELTVEIGLALKKTQPANTYVAGYTNGYNFYLPTENQRKNTGFAQEDCDCLVAPEWQRVFEESAKQILDGL
ncbi:MAG: hypothetical protein U0930_02835 [Pirellulales bacterium]